MCSLTLFICSLIATANYVANTQPYNTEGARCNPLNSTWYPVPGRPSSFLACDSKKRSAVTSSTLYQLQSWLSKHKGSLVKHLLTDYIEHIVTIYFIGLKINT